ncbi:MAG: FAD-dependent oxidoreductase [Clostridiales bacterium]|nr:FAD-dependent oxidoreductase [Clostridiales bacterium]
MNPKYPNLLSPTKIGNVELRNKTVMAAMGMSQSDEGFVNKAVINHYAERAKGGVGAVVVEVTCVDTPLGLNTKGMLVIDDDKYIPGMSDLASAIHEGGAKAFLQISHTGRGARRAIIGDQPVGPSAVAMPYTFMMGLANETPRALTIPEIKEIEEKYAQAALRAKKAGFDGVEIHSVGYYMGQQFLSKTANIRKDEYGGSRKNRMRFHVNIIRRIRELCGPDFAIIVKAPAIEIGTYAGISIFDAAYFFKHFQDEGVDAIEVLAGMWSSEAGKNTKPESAYPDCQATILAKVMKIMIFLQTGRKAKIHMIGGGRAQNPVAAEKALRSKQCDSIFIGHGLLVQPDLVKLIDECREDEIRPCIGCGHCIDHQLQHGGKAICSGNAVLARGDNDYTITPAKEKKHVVVIGGGVAGVEAARICAIRGHDVDLYEADKIGGQMNLAGLPPFKQHLQLLTPYLENQLKITGVKTHLGKKVTAEEVLAMNADAVVCATGVKPANLPIPGAEKAINAKEILTGAPFGKHVVMIGGGSIGCETAEFLADKGAKVTIIEMLDTLAGNTGKTAQTILLGHLKARHVDMLTECKVASINDGSVTYTDKEGKSHDIPADTVVLAIGDKPNASLYEALKDKVSEIYNIGDSNGGGIIPNACYEGYTVGNKI